MYPYIIEALEPFRKKGYLTTFHRKSNDSALDEGEMVLGPLTIIGTGDTQVNDVLGQNPRDFFLDAPLTALSRPIIYPNPKTGDMGVVDWNPTFSPVASGKFPIDAYATQDAVSVLPFTIPSGVSNLIPSLFNRSVQQVETESLAPPSNAESRSLVPSTVAAHIQLAHSKGIETRWWGVVNWPRFVRVRVWQKLMDWGEDWLNADELEEAADFLRRRGAGQVPVDG